jgi:hypothetical protein
LFHSPASPIYAFFFYWFGVVVGSSISFAVLLGFFLPVLLPHFAKEHS